MTHVRSSIASVPVFALEDYALMPYTVAAFQVFEPSCRELIDDSEATDGLLVVAGLTPSSAEPDAPAGGAVQAVAGLGKIVNVRRLHDESREVYVHGVARVRLRRFLREHPYPLAQVERLDDVLERSDRRRQRVTLRRLHDYLNGALRAGRLSRGLSRVISAADDPSVLSYRLGTVLLEDPAARQAFLEERSPAARLETLIEALAARLMDDSDESAAPDGGAGTVPIN